MCFDGKELKGNGAVISGDFLRPAIVKVQVTQYESEAIIVAKGEKLWFVHSIKLAASPVIKKPFLSQSSSVSFKEIVDNIKIPDGQETHEIVIFSHFHPPLRAQVCVQLDVSVEARVYPSDV